MNNCIFLDIPLDIANKYSGALCLPPVPHRLNKRMLRVKPHFVLSSKAEIERKLKLIECKEAEEKLKQERFLLSVS